MPEDFQLGEAEYIQRIGETEYERIYFEHITRRLSRERNKLEDEPRTDPENIKNDWRYKSGFVAALKWVLQRPVEARKYLQYLEENLRR